MANFYDDKYQNEDLYWGTQPTSMAKNVVEAISTENHIKILEIGCGEGRDAVFFAQAGWQVTAFDFSAIGVEKTRDWLERLGLAADVFEADINNYGLETPFDVVFSSGTLQYISPNNRGDVIQNYKQFTNLGGLHAFTFPVLHTDLPKEPGSDTAEFYWEPGEIRSHYFDWVIEYFTEEVLRDQKDHPFAVNRLMARKPHADS